VDRAGDFKVISDGKLTLKYNSASHKSAEKFTFTLPDLAPGNSGVLAFVCFLRDAAGLHFTMNLNGHDQLEYWFNGSDVKTLHEVVAGEVLQEVGNQLFVSVGPGQGELGVADLVLWYRRNLS
jgi:hypothetical protein